MSNSIESPCVKVCAIDPVSGWCLGCGRSMAEIGRWSTLSVEERKAVIATLDERKAQIRDRETRARNYRLPGS